MSLLIIIAITATAAIIRGSLLETHVYTVPAKATGKVRIVALSDLHGHMLGRNQERIVSKVREAAPDFIVYLGDMIEESSAEESVEPVVCHDPLLLGEQGK